MNSSLCHRCDGTGVVCRGCGVAVFGCVCGLDRYGAIMPCPSCQAKSEVVEAKQTTTPEQRIEELENAIKAHRDAKGHDRCWLNDHELYSVLRDGKSVDFALPAKCEFLEQCEKYWDERQP